MCLKCGLRNLFARLLLLKLGFAVSKQLLGSAFPPGWRLYGAFDGVVHPVGLYIVCRLLLFFLGGAEGRNRGMKNRMDRSLLARRSVVTLDLGIVRTGEMFKVLSVASIMWSTETRGLCEMMSL
ncbi:uncharacterized protein BDZ99DRAFT_127666 [Mytilinidion resinicola]|uniref:Uncharacterized protein n=1 Tax=Mytilinidion resinicola TaxID=574789 RepID=A0A6A6Z4U8_9PEZI|nr:uncharacterized protein BDZ99DRAFT_127666 [Mytilinidion resinicola]KAF2816050.1 hypothetical protein BDZ99DRAFT_127666 [Mytilinidion resinicola]